MIYVEVSLTHPDEMFNITKWLADSGITYRHTGSFTHIGTFQSVARFYIDNETHRTAFLLRWSNT